TRDLERKSIVLQTRLGYREERWGHVTLSGYASGIQRGGDLAHWAQLTDGSDAEGRNVGTTVALGQYRVDLDALFHLHKTLDLAFQSTYFDGGVLPDDRVEIASDVFYVERDLGYRGTDTMVEARY